MMNGNEATNSFDAEATILQETEVNTLSADAPVP